MKILVPEVSDEVIDIKLGSKFNNNIYSAFEECARVYYWGMNGWNNAWPLYFEMYSDRGVLISTADIYLLTGSPPLMFDVLIKSGISYVEGNRV